MNIKTNSQFDLDFEEIEKQISNLPVPQNFEQIYDFAKRYIRIFGFDVRAIEKIYLLGFIDGEIATKKDNDFYKKVNRN